MPELSDLSVERLIEYLEDYFPDLVETQQGFIIRKENEAADYRYHVYYTVAVRHYLFLFHNLTSNSCLEVLNLKFWTMREHAAGSMWPKQCSCKLDLSRSGFQPQELGVDDELRECLIALSCRVGCDEAAASSASIDAPEFDTELELLLRQLDEPRPSGPVEAFCETGGQQGSLSRQAQAPVWKPPPKPAPKPTRGTFTRRGSAFNADRQQLQQLQQLHQQQQQQQQQSDANAAAGTGFPPRRKSSSTAAGGGVAMPSARKDSGSSALSGVKEKLVTQQGGSTLLPPKDTLSPPPKDASSSPTKSGMPALPSKDGPSLPSKNGTSRPSKDGPFQPPKDTTSLPPKDNPSLPSKDSPSLPPKGTPSLPPRDGPSLPPKDGPSLPPKDGPSLPPKDGPSLPPKDGPSLPPKDGPPLPPKDGPSQPPKDNPALPPKNSPAPSRDAPVLPPRDLLTPPTRDVPGLRSPSPLEQQRQQSLCSATGTDDSGSCGASAGIGQSDLYELLTSDAPCDAIGSYFCLGYYTSKEADGVRQALKGVSQPGAYMLSGFSGMQAGQEKTLRVKYKKIYKFRIHQSDRGFQIDNQLNPIEHSSMHALLYHHHLFPLKGPQEIGTTLLLTRPYNFSSSAAADAAPESVTAALSACVWKMGSKDLCAEVLKKAGDGTYAIRLDEKGKLVLCLCHGEQIVKFRIDRTDTKFHLVLQQSSIYFNSLEQLLIHYHSNPINSSLAAGNRQSEIYLKLPFQLVQQCQEELNVRLISLPLTFIEREPQIAVTAVNRLKSSNFLIRRRPGANSIEAIVVKDDKGNVQSFDINETFTQLSFEPHKIVTLKHRPELAATQIENIVQFLCHTKYFLNPNIELLIRPSV